MKGEQSTFSALAPAGEADRQSQHAPEVAASPRKYISNLLVNEALKYLPAAVEHPTTEAFQAFLRENLHFNSANTRSRYAQHIAHRYSHEGIVNRALARFLKSCPDERARREVLWFETVRAAPLLKEMCAAWLAKTPETGACREELLAFLRPRVGERKPEKIAKEVVTGLKKFGHLQSPKQQHYIAVWGDPPLDVVAYALTQLYPGPAVVKMEEFKNNTLWQALLWPAGGMERLILEGERTGVVSSVTKLDKYYQFALEGTGEQRLSALLAKWGPVNGKLA
jgi:hypothetical protein